MKVAIIGPVAPFRGGIARHTGALALALAGRPDDAVTVVSFSRQYPGFLYPGESDREDGAAPPPGIDCAYIIDSLNPLTWRRAVAEVAGSAPDLAVIPAWTFFLAPCLGYIARGLRRRGIPVVMIVHNAEDHEARGWKTGLSAFQVRQASAFVTHNAGIAGALARLAPGIPARICPHPVYDDFPAPEGTLPRRAGLELLFFGLVRPYKGLDIALKALERSGREDVHLTVAGEFWEGLDETRALIRTLNLGDRVELVPRYVSDQEAAEFFARADAVVAPYRSASGSGVVALAQWYDRPVVASDIPGLASAVSDGETGWLFPPEDIDALARLLAERVDRESAAAMHPAIEAVKDASSWERFAATVRAATSTEP